MPKSDGSVIFTVKLDAKDAEKQAASLKNKIIKLEASLNEQGYKKTALDEQLTAAGVRADEAKVKLSALIAERDRLKSLTPADGTEYMTAGQNITVLNQQIKEQEATVKELDKEFNNVANSVGRINQKMQDTTGAISAAKAQYAEMKQKAEELTAEEERQRIEADRQAKIEEVRAQAVRDKAALAEKNAELERRLADEAERSAGGMRRTRDEAKGLKGALSDINSRMAKFTERIIGLAKRVFVFTLITKALRTVREYLWNAIKTNDQAISSIAKLKGAMMTLAEPIIQYIIPLFTRVVELLATVASYAANVVSSLFGTSASKSAAQAQSRQQEKQADDAKKASDNLKNEAEALEEVGEESKEAQKQLAGFDELNILSSDNSEDAADNFKDEMDDFDGLDDLLDTGDEASEGIAPDFSGLIDRELGAIDALIGAALIAVGAILAFSGANVPLGLAMMVAGFLLEYEVIKENWGAIQEAMQGPLGVLAAILSVELLVIGAILVFAGAHVGLGLGLMIAGAMGLATVVAANWDTIVAAMQGPIGVLTGILMAALFVLGAVIAFSGVTPYQIGLGIGMMIAGAAGLATVVAINWNTIVEALQGPIGVITTMLSAALLVIGGVIAFSAGANLHALGLGIGLMILGAAGLATVVAVNWDTITNALQGPIGAITGILTASALVLGAIFTFTGANIPLGLGLMFVGAMGLAASLAANWDFISDKLSGELGIITAAASVALLALGVILCLSGVGIPLGISLIAAGAVGLVTVTAVNWGDGILDGIKTAWGKIKGWFKHEAQPDAEEMGENIGAGMAEGVNTSQKLTNEAMLEMKESMVEEAKKSLEIHSPSGVFKDIGNNIVLGLKEGIKEKASLVIDAVSGIWEDIKSWFDDSVSPKLNAQYWEDKLSSIGDGFKNAITSGINAGIEVVERGINWIISALNKISFSVPEWVPSIGGKRFGFNMSEITIPRLARGAVIPPNREFMAVLGDQKSGVNVEAPLNTIKEAVLQALNEAGGMGGGTIVLKVDLDGREIARTTYANYRQMARAGTLGTVRT